MQMVPKKRAETKTTKKQKNEKTKTSIETISPPKYSREDTQQTTTGLRQSTQMHSSQSTLTTDVRRMETDVANPLTTLSAYLTTMATTRPPSEFRNTDIHTLTLYLMDKTRKPSAKCTEKNAQVFCLEQTVYSSIVEQARNDL